MYNTFVILCHELAITCYQTARLMQLLKRTYYPKLKRSLNYVCPTFEKSVEFKRHHKKLCFFLYLLLIIPLEFVLVMNLKKVKWSLETYFFQNTMFSVMGQWKGKTSNNLETK